MYTSEFSIWHGHVDRPPPLVRHPPETLSRLRQFGVGRDPRTEDLKWRVSRLQLALIQARRWARITGEFSAAIAVLMLALGFTFGVYREPIQQSIRNLTQTLGLARNTADADAIYMAYQGRDYATALRLARPLAAEGDAHAQYMLGLLYHRGRGLPRDHNEAVNWFRRAADQDDAAAQFYLGIMFSEGHGVRQDHIEAAKWFRRAADLGDAYAQYNLGVLYAKGEAGAADNVSAHMWFNLAAAHFPTSDTVNRNAALNSRNLVAKKMKPDEIAEAEKRTREWKPSYRGAP
jgi:uncharacterized protein